MALLTLFDKRNQIAFMDLDVTIREEHEMSAQISRSAVESGADITDNVVLSPRRLTMEGIVAKHPLRFYGIAGAAATTAASAFLTPGGSIGSNVINTAALAGVGKAAGLVSSYFNPIEGPKSRDPLDVFQYLERIFEARLPFNVQSEMKAYTNMVFTSLKIPRDVKTTDILRFTAVMEKIEIVRSETGSHTLPETGAVSDGASAKANLGKQSATEASSKVSSDASALLQISRSVGGGS